MIGIFDSGVGGLTALTELRRLLPEVNVTYLADRENAPYGTKSAEEILSFAKKNIHRLRALGAERILIACCTASTLYDRLEEDEKKISVPLIFPTARAAVRATASGKIAVLATKATVKSRAFSAAVSELMPSAQVLETSSQPLVSMIEGGARDGLPLTEADLETLKKHILPVRKFGADTLILGCTHFPHIAGHISRLLPCVKLISSSLEGALEIAKHAYGKEEGRTVYL